MKLMHINNLLAYLNKHVITGAILLLLFSLSMDAGAQNTSAKKPLLTPLQVKEKIKGPILSTPTAFTQNYDIDYKGMEKLIKRALNYECKVVTLTPGDSRYSLLSYNEVKQLTRFYRETVDDRAIFIASSGTWDQDTVLDYARYAESLGVSALSVTRPKGMDNNTPMETIVNFFKKVAATTRLGILLHGYYSEELLNELVKIPSIVGLKEDVADLHYYISRQVKFGDRIVVYAGGSDSRILIGYPYGSPAYFTALYSFAPQIGLKFWNAVKSNDTKTAIEISDKYDRPFIERFSFPFWTAAIEYSGGSQRYQRPLKEELNETQQLEMQTFMDKLDVIPHRK